MSSLVLLLVSASALFTLQVLLSVLDCLDLFSNCLLLPLSLIAHDIEQIKKLLKNGSVEHEISIFWVPRRTLVSNKILEDEGVLGDVNVLEFPMYFLPLEDDILSLELEDAFMEMYLVSLNSAVRLN